MAARAAPAAPRLAARRGLPRAERALLLAVDGRSHGRRRRPRHACAGPVRPRSGGTRDRLLEPRRPVRHAARGRRLPAVVRAQPAPPRAAALGLPQGPPLDRHDGLRRQLPLPLGRRSSSTRACSGCRSRCSGRRPRRRCGWRCSGRSGATSTTRTSTSPWARSATCSTARACTCGTTTPPTRAGSHKNFGIVLSLWDFLFRTAYWPRDRSPLRLGYRGDEEMPAGLLGQLSWPLLGRRLTA